MVSVDLAAQMIHAELDGLVILISEQLLLIPPKLEFVLKMNAPKIQSVRDSLNTVYSDNVKTKIVKLKVIALNQTSAQVQTHAVLAIKEVAPMNFSVTTRTFARNLNAMFMTIAPQIVYTVMMVAGTTDLATNVTLGSAQPLLTAQKLDTVLQKEPVVHAVIPTYVLYKMKTLTNLSELSHAKKTAIALLTNAKRTKTAQL